MKSAKECVKCGSKYVVNKTYCLCDNCNYIRLHGESRFETSIKRKFIKSSQKTQIKRKETLNKDRDVYRQVFNRGNCRCENCNNPLPNEFEDENGNLIAIFRYSHILPKSRYPEYRHESWNISDSCLDCHQQWDFGDKKSMPVYNRYKQIVIEKTGRDLLK